jgi:diguanylate cyclase (GGDEF)-like protein
MLKARPTSQRPFAEGVSPVVSGSQRSWARPDWWVVTLPGLALVVVAFWVTGRQVSALPAAFWVIAAQGVVFELRPVLATRQQPEGILLSTAFIFAVVFSWGLWPGVVVMTVGNLARELIDRRPMSDALFTIGTLALGFGSAAGTMALFGVHPTIGHPIHAIEAVDLVWMLLAWVAHFLVVHFLVNHGATLIYGPSRWADFKANFVDEFWFYVVSDLVVVGLAPLVVVLAQTASPVLLLLIASPFLAVWKGAAFSRSQEEVALHDILTGLPDRRLFLERYAEYAATGDSALLLVDLDGFKEVNDTYGHLAGDLLLREVGVRLRRSIGPDDLAARLGGDEFAVLLPGVRDGATALRVADRVRESLRTPFAFEDRELCVEGSVGVALAPMHSRDVGELLRCADVAMYVAKRNGLGALVYSEDDAESAQMRARLEGGRGRAGRRVADQPVRTEAESV